MSLRLDGVIMKYLVLTLLIILLSACQEQLDIDTKEISISEVQSHYHALQQQPQFRVSSELSKPDILWEEGEYGDISLGDALLFPLEYESGLYLSDSTRNIIQSAESNFYGFAYKQNDEVHFELVKVVKTANSEKFTGFILAEDWLGNPLRYFKYENGIFTGEHEIVVGAENQRTNEFVYTCVTTIYYTCWGDIPADCREDSRSTVCTVKEVRELHGEEGASGGDYGPGGPSKAGNNQASCDPDLGYFQDADGNCIREACNEGQVRDENGDCVCEMTGGRIDGDCQCPNGFELVGIRCLEECPSGHLRDEFDNCYPDDCDTRGGDLEKAFPNADREILDSLAAKLNRYGKGFGIDTKEKLQHFLAQTGHETGGFQQIGSSEKLNYSVNRLLEVWPNRFSQTDSTKPDPDDYANNPERLANYIYCCRMGNSNEKSGDGYLYHGRGIIQLTGYNNYRAFNSFYQENFDSSIDLLANPELLAINDNVAVLSALWYYEKFVLNNVDVNENTDVDEVSKRINPGEKREILDKRKKKFDQLKPLIDCNEDNKTN